MNSNTVTHSVLVSGNTRNFARSLDKNLFLACFASRRRNNCFKNIFLFGKEKLEKERNLDICEVLIFLFSQLFS